MNQMGTGIKKLQVKKNVTQRVLKKYFLRPPASVKNFQASEAAFKNNHLLKKLNFRRKKFILTAIGFGSGCVRNGARHHNFVAGFFYVLNTYSAHISPNCSIPVLQFRPHFLVQIYRPMWSAFYLYVS